MLFNRLLAKIIDSSWIINFLSKKISHLDKNDTRQKLSVSQVTQNNIYNY